MKEIWKDIKDYEGLYQISNLGRIKSLNREFLMENKLTKNMNVRKIKEKILNQYENKDKYLSVYLYKNKIRKMYLVHRLVAQNFIINNKNYCEINHIDNNKQNNCDKNLEWCSRQYNIEYFSRTCLVGNSKRKTRYQPTEQYDLDGKYLKTWKTILDAEKFYNTNHISECCRGKYQVIKGYRWKYANY